MKKKLSPIQQYKAYQIVTKIHNPGDMSIYSGRTAGEAKTSCVMDMRDAYPDATYSWIKSCRRSPEYDRKATPQSDCLFWKDGSERWDVKEGHHHSWE